MYTDKVRRRFLQVTLPDGRQMHFANRLAFLKTFPDGNNHNYVTRMKLPRYYRQMYFELVIILRGDALDDPAIKKYQPELADTIVEAATYKKSSQHMFNVSSRSTSRFR